MNNTYDENKSYEKCVSIALNFIRKNPDYINFIKNYDNPRGFTYSRSDILDKINNVIENDECSKAITFANCMDNCRNKLKYDNSKSQYSLNKSN